MSERANAWAIYQRVAPADQPLVETWIAPFHDEHLEICLDGSYRIGNGVPQRWWIEENRKKLSPRMINNTLEVLTHWGL